MNPQKAKALYSLILPQGLVLGAIIFYLHFFATPKTVLLVAPIYSSVVLVAGVLLGWRFNRSRLVFSLLVLALSERGLFCLFHIQGINDVVKHTAFGSMALLLPVNFVLLSIMRERGIFTFTGLWRASVILLQVSLVVLIAYYHPEKVIVFFNYNLLSPRVLQCTPIPQSALIVIGLGLIFFLIRFRYKQKPMEIGFFWALFTAVIALSQNKERFVTVYFATAGLILVISLIETAHAMAYQDELTSLPGRRALKEYLLKLVSEYTIAMLDIDHFKKFNDTYGHNVGDQVLRMVASKLAAVSGGGKAFRYGGEEFTLVFSKKSLGETTPHLEDLRETVASSRFTIRGSKRPQKKPKTIIPVSGERKKLSVTVSIGVAVQKNNQKSAQVIKAADKALYRAKKSGRNQVST
ncbi:MAG: GGDEF domain-containing protein [Thermodesulfobacteriota bacterium]|nr:MAG: GGDEF domain-containing protein [Thermodesulfobacteriota bacterium]